MAEAVKVLNLANEKYNLGFELSFDDLGGAAIDRYGVPLADETLERARAADAVLLGAVGGPKCLLRLVVELHSNYPKQHL